VPTSSKQYKINILFSGKNTASIIDNYHEWGILGVRDEEDRMDQQERAAFEQMTDLETILGAGFLLMAEDARRK
jgi:hypothetical protein